ncbi:MAG TPA: hypothetical protein VEQ59_17670 [Polyangiaceae bacterium]|nr:hypothetical protein [Polyangiaceae bacterium]
MALFSLSGGLVYHARAARYREGLWAPFRRDVAAWLAEVLPAGDELILVGPSAGHCLPLAHFSRFARLTLLEPDPVARWLLLGRLSQPRVEVEPHDQLLQPLLHDRAGLDAVLERRPRAAVLFCNLLGQLQLELGHDEQQRFVREFRRRIVPQLAGRRWASFHDHWSLDRDVTAPAVPSPIALPHIPSDEELGRACFGPDGAAVTVLEHGTRELFPEPGPRRYFAWQLTPSALHVVEAVSGAAD